MWRAPIDSVQSGSISLPLSSSPSPSAARPLSRRCAGQPRRSLSRPRMGRRRRGPFPSAHEVAMMRAPLGNAQGGWPLTAEAWGGHGHSPSWRCAGRPGPFRQWRRADTAPSGSAPPPLPPLSTTAWIRRGGARRWRIRPQRSAQAADPVGWCAPVADPAGKSARAVYLVGRSSLAADTAAWHRQGGVAPDPASASCDGGSASRSIICDDGSVSGSVVAPRWPVVGLETGCRWAWKWAHRWALGFFIFLFINRGGHL